MSPTLAAVYDRKVSLIKMHHEAKANKIVGQSQRQKMEQKCTGPLGRRLE